MVEIVCVITGKVQDVAYLAYAQDSADELEICGWAKQSADGSIMVCAQGTPDLLKEYVEYLHEGSLRSRVDAVSVEWGTPKVTLSDFSIRH